MKKIAYLLLVVFVGAMLSGCGSKKVVKCSYNVKTDQLEYSATYKITVTGDDFVESVSTEEILKSDEPDYLSQAKESAEELYSSANQQYGGYKYNVKISGNTLTSTCDIDYDKMDIEKYVEDNPTLTNFTENGKVKLSGVISIYEQLGAKCEK